MGTASSADEQSGFDSFSVHVATSHKSCTGAKRGKMLMEDEIWDTALQIWNGLPSCKISSGYIQAYRIAQKVNDCNGCNNFLKGSKITLRCSA